MIASNGTEIIHKKSVVKFSSWCLGTRTSLSVCRPVSESLSVEVQNSKNPGQVSKLFRAITSTVILFSQSLFGWCKGEKLEKKKKFTVPLLERLPLMVLSLDSGRPGARKKKNCHLRRRPRRGGALIETDPSNGA